MKARVIPNVTYFEGDGCENGLGGDNGQSEDEAITENELTTKVGS
jgi:hypothetical protein